MRSVHVLANDDSGASRERRDAVIDRLRTRGLEVTVLDGSTPTSALDHARRVARRGGERIIAVGGDGAVHLGANAVAETDTTLGVVPAGTGNDFARALGLLDTHIDAQLDRALAPPVDIDAIRTDHGWVATVATLGFSGDVTDRANSMRWPSGSHRYTLATLVQLPRLRSIDVSVEVDGVRVGGSTSLLSVGSTAWFGGGMKICPTARADDGLLHVVNIASVPRRRFLRVFPAVFSGRHVRRDEVETARGRVATIDGLDHIDLWGDGERLGPLPVRLEIVPGALRVAGAVPQQA